MRLLAVSGGSASEGPSRLHGGSRVCPAQVPAPVTERAQAFLPGFPPPLHSILVALENANVNSS